MFIRNIRLLYRTTVGYKKLENSFCKEGEKKARKSRKFQKIAKKIDFFEVSSGKA